MCLEEFFSTHIQFSYILVVSMPCITLRAHSLGFLPCSEVLPEGISRPHTQGCNIVHGVRCHNFVLCLGLTEICDADR